MMLWRFSSGGKPQRGEDRIGGSRGGLPLNPLLNLGQTFRRLMDVVAVGDVGKGFEQLFKAFAAIQRRISDRMTGAASWCAHRRQHSFLLSHACAFPHDIPDRIQIRPVAG
jgi:hypothetical protein